MGAVLQAMILVTVHVLRVSSQSPRHTIISTDGMLRFDSIVFRAWQLFLLKRVSESLSVVSVLNVCVWLVGTGCLGSTRGAARRGFGAAMCLRRVG